jgi:MFS family permease
VRTAVTALPTLVRRVRSGRAFAFLAIAATVGSMTEGATAYWSADLILTQTSASLALAASSVSGLVAGVAASRLIVGPLSLRRESFSLLFVALGLCAIGWVILWLSSSVIVAVVGLVIMGAGIGPLYPLSATLAMRVATNTLDVAQARLQLLGGIGSAFAPFGLGGLTDLFGAHIAFTAIPVLLLVALVAVVLGRATVRGEQTWRLKLRRRRGVRAARG